MTTYQEVLNNSKLRVDPVSCLEDLEKALNMVLNGYETERVSPKGQLVTIVEKHPDVVPKIIKAKLDVLEVLRKEVPENVQCKLIVTGLDLSSQGEIKKFPA